jgi:hypothetical protein
MRISRPCTLLYASVLVLSTELSVILGTSLYAVVFTFSNLYGSDMSLVLRYDRRSVGQYILE